MATKKPTRVKKQLAGETVEITPEAKVEEITKDLIKVEEDAQKIVVKTEADVESASKFLISTIKPRINRIKELQESFTKPHQEARKLALDSMRRIEELFAPTLAPLERIEKTVKRAIADYKLEEDRKARAEEERKIKIREDANKKREEEGKEMIQTPIATVERSEATVKTDEGKSTAKKVWKFEIEAYSQLPKNVIDEILYQAKEAGVHDKVIRKMVNAGVREMTGVRIYEDYDVSVTAK